MKSIVAHHISYSNHSKSAGNTPNSAKINIMTSQSRDPDLQKISHILYDTCDMGIYHIQKSFWGYLQPFSRVKLCKKTRIYIHTYISLFRHRGKISIPSHFQTSASINFSLQILTLIQAKTNCAKQILITLTGTQISGHPKMAILAIL